MVDNGAGDAGDTPLQSAVWMAQDLGITMPPVPDIYANTLNEIGLGRLFATRPELLALDSRGSIEVAIQGSGWPSSGLAFGFREKGNGGRWFYTLTGEQSILHVSLRVDFSSDVAGRVDTAIISAANGHLDAFLANEASYRRAISFDPPPHGAPRRIVVYTDAEGVAEESTANWVAGSKTLEFTASEQIFTDREMPSVADEMIFRI